MALADTQLDTAQLMDLGTGTSTGLVLSDLLTPMSNDLKTVFALVAWQSKETLIVDLFS